MIAQELRRLADEIDRSPGRQSDMNLTSMTDSAGHAAGRHEATKRMRDRAAEIERQRTTGDTARELVERIGSGVKLTIERSGNVFTISKIVKDASGFVPTFFVIGLDELDELDGLLAEFWSIRFAQ